MKEQNEKDFIFNEICVACYKRTYLNCEYRIDKREQPDCKEGKFLQRAFRSGIQFGKRWIPIDEDLPGGDEYDRCLWKDADGHIWYGMARQSHKLTHWKSVI